eukprot:CAMPEP_0116014602 /NCGR_PEP_ID=MMETSP0321-20121206/6359_1 /TAXON_ID=163516 /ORGANISM="Leptocylindrus danicus var. danicus, Strain B650" /LENGTH=357 /DNA_ID=CAMNT_0003484253 /DNA_START=220 /DNA_END=1293 /DNA_ORIENTATION=+
MESWRKNDTVISLPQLSSNFKYSDNKQEWPKKEENCVSWEPWQDIMFPTCATMHEVDMTLQIAFLAKGGRRVVWKVSSPLNSTEEVVLKTLKINRFARDNERKLAEMHRIDAVAMERLTSSKHIMDIFGFCGQSALNEIGDVSMFDYIPNTKLSSFQKLRFARDAAVALFDVHSFGSRAMIVHGDIRPWNFIVSNNGSLRLNDFNAGDFLYRDTTTRREHIPESSSSCSITKYKGCHSARSPEECLMLPAREMIDVYHLGNVFYYIMTGDSPYKRMEEFSAENNLVTKSLCETCAQSFQEGMTPYNYTLPLQLQSSADPAIDAIQDAMSKCQILDPTLRPSARKITKDLNEALIKLL